MSTRFVPVTAFSIICEVFADRFPGATAAVLNESCCSADRNTSQDLDTAPPGNPYEGRYDPDDPNRKVPVGGVLILESVSAIHCPGIACIVAKPQSG
jgi:hypothetical protein